MPLFKRNQHKEIKLSWEVLGNGLKPTFHMIEGSNVLPLPFPLEDIQPYFTLRGFNKYIEMVRLLENDLLTDGLFTYDTYYKLQETTEDEPVYFETIGLPATPIAVTGKLSLLSLPQEANLRLELFDEHGRNLSRMANVVGAAIDHGTHVEILPKEVFELKQALDDTSYESPVEKIAICQSYAKAAGLSMDGYLERETFEVQDTFDIDVVVHAPDDVELVPIYTDKTTVRDGWNRQRIFTPQKTKKAIDYVRKNNRFKGEDVAKLATDPASIFEGLDVPIDLSKFSDRVKGLIPITTIGIGQRKLTGYEWLGNQDDSDKWSEISEDALREAVERNPESNFAYLDGVGWIYVSAALKRHLLGIDSNNERSSKPCIGLDIHDNEENLDYTKEDGNQEKIHVVPFPSSIHATPFQHQVEGFNWLISIYKSNIGGLLADDMGLGKTLQVIAFLVWLHETDTITPSLIVVPKALLQNWCEEIAKFAPHLPNPYVCRRVLESEASTIVDTLQRSTIVITTYDTLRINQAYFGQVDFKCIICDEAQNMKNHASLRSRAIRAMKGEFRLAMTGTPVETGVDNLWSIMDFVQPGALGALRAFEKEYSDIEMAEKLVERIEKYYLRRTKEQVMKDQLPKKIERDPIYVHASPLQQSLAEGLVLRGLTRSNVLDRINRLRQLYSHPGVVNQLYDELNFKEVPKLYEVIKMLDEIKNKNEKVIIFTEYKRMQSILKRDIMLRYGVDAYVLNGETDNKQWLVKKFQSKPGFSVMILAPKAAGVGLNITCANHVIHYTRWWNPAVENQATDRAYRIGQKKDVYVYHVITQDKKLFPDGSLEETLHKLLLDRRAMADNIAVPIDAAIVQDELVKRFVKMD